MLKEEANKGLKKEEVFVAGDGNASVKTETSSFDNATEFENSTDVETIKCPDCGSNMVFDPTKQDLFCEHCGRVESFEKDGVKPYADISLSSAEKLGLTINSVFP